MRPRPTVISSPWAWPDDRFDTFDAIIYHSAHQLPYTAGRLSNTWKRIPEVLDIPRVRMAPLSWSWPYIRARGMWLDVLTTMSRVSTTWNVKTYPGGAWRTKTLVEWCSLRHGETTILTLVLYFCVWLTIRRAAYDILRVDWRRYQSVSRRSSTCYNMSSVLLPRAWRDDYYNIILTRMLVLTILRTSYHVLDPHHPNLNRISQIPSTYHDTARLLLPSALRCLARTHIHLARRTTFPAAALRFLRQRSFTVSCPHSATINALIRPTAHPHFAPAQVAWELFE
jgi:hypothetical protein